MIFRRSSLVESAKRYLEEYTLYDPLELGFYIRRRLFDYMAGRGPKNLLKDLADLMEIARMFSFNSMISMSSLLATIILDSGYVEKIDKKGYSLFLKNLLDIIERGDVDSIKMQSQTLTIELLSGSHLYAPAGGKILERIIMNARSKISYVRVSEGGPLKHGVELSRRLLKAGINAIPVPDNMKYWAIERSHSLIIASYAMTNEGLLVTDHGVKPAVKLAWRIGKPVFVVGPWSSQLAQFSADEIAAQASVLDVRPYDIIDPGEGESLLVTGRFAVRLDRETALNTIHQARRSLKEIVRIAYTNVAGGR